MISMTRFALAATVLGTVGLTGCTTDNDRNMMAEAAIRGSDVRFDAENGDFNYLYRYYPNEAVYQSVYNGTWYWPTESGWRHGDTLPAESTVAGHYHLLELPSQKPYTQHFQVSQRFPDRETLEARALAYDLALGRRSANGTGEGDAVFATAPTDDRPQP
jgi:hypothetical protein